MYTLNLNNHLIKQHLLLRYSDKSNLLQKKNRKSFAVRFKDLVYFMQKCVFVDIEIRLLKQIFLSFVSVTKSFRAPPC